MTNSTGTIVHWFRKGLRIHDNPALLAAIEGIDGELYELRPIFILDPQIAKKLKVGPNRWRFLQQSLQNLDTNLRNIGTRLFVVRGTPEEVLERLFDEWNVKCITFESDIEPYSRGRDSKIEKLAKAAGVKVVQKVSHTLYPPEVIIAKNLGAVPLTYQKFLSLVEKVGAPRKPCPSPTELPLICKSPRSGISDEEMTVPTLEELGVKETELGPCLYPGGETEALSRMERYLLDQQYVRTFEKPKTSPTSLEPSTTVLSPHLKFGCLSVSTFYYALQKVLTGAKHTQPPVSLKGQIMWREFYYTVASDTPNFDKMEGNKICTQIPWNNKKEYLEAWAWGRTGYPWIDAVMTQLRQEGWIHHLARHAVACFLTRGDLWVSWEEGQKVFEELLLDADWALNAGNWMWLSASAFFRQFFRVYSPVVFPKKTDSTGEYVRKYIPALRKIPAEYIYEPWEAPKSVLEKAGCVLGVDYPKRIVMHNAVYKKNIARMSKAYKDNKANNQKPISSKRKKVKDDSDTGGSSDSDADDDIKDSSDKDEDKKQEQKRKSKSTPSKKSRSRK